MGTSYNFDKVWSGAPDGRFGKLSLKFKGIHILYERNGIVTKNSFVKNEIPSFKVFKGIGKVKVLVGY